MPSSKTLGTYQGDDEVEYEANGHNRAEYVIETHCGLQTRASVKIERLAAKAAAPMVTKTKSRAKLVIEVPFQRDFPANRCLLRLKMLEALLEYRECRI
jgi:hypothetical protein